MSLSMLAYCRLYEDLLTPYAWKFVKDQLSAIEFVKIKEQYLDGTLVTNSRRGNNVVFTTHCSCIESRSLVLPCRHIFKCHQMRHLPLFWAELCDIYWNKENYKQHQKLISQIPNSDLPQIDMSEDVSFIEISIFFSNFLYVKK